MKRLRLTVAGLLVVLALLFSGCGSQEKGQSSYGPPAKSSETVEEKQQERQVEQTKQAQEQQTKQTQEQQSPVPLIEATVTRVVDGDTVYVSISGKEEKVRFIGVDTPESTTQVEPYGPEASDYTKSRLDGRKIYLEKDVQERDKYGRLLAYIWLEKPAAVNDSEIRAKMFNAHLLLNGYAQVMTVPPNVKYADYFVKYQREAREKNVGLWAITVPPASSSGSNSSSGNSTQYIGNSSSKKFHYPSCQWAQKISPSNRVYFNSRQEAINAGYVPCKVCKP